MRCSPCPGSALGARLLAGLLLAVCFAGCSPGAPGRHNPVGPIGAPAAPVSSTPAPSPSWSPYPSLPPMDSDPARPTLLAPFRLTSTEKAILDYAHQSLIHDCMRRFGLSYPPVQYRWVLNAQRAHDAYENGRLFGPTDPAIVREMGYQPKLIDTRDGPRLAGEVRSNFLVLNGTMPGGEPPGSSSPGMFAGQQIPPRGCTGEAFRRIGDEGGFDWGSLAHRLGQESLDLVEGEEGYARISSDWVACMKQAGHHVTSLLSDKGDIDRLTSQTTTPRPTPEEIKLASDDVECKKKTRSVERLIPLSRAVEKRIIANNLTALRANRAKLDRKLRLAQAGIEATGGFR